MSNYTKQILVLSREEALRECFYTPVASNEKKVIPVVHEREINKEKTWDERALDRIEQLMKENNITFARIFLNKSLYYTGEMLTQIKFVMVYNKIDINDETHKNILMAADSIGLDMDSFKELIESKRGDDIISRLVDIYQSYNMLFGNSGSAVAKLFKDKNESSIKEETIKRLCRLSLLGCSFQNVYKLPKDKDEEKQMIDKLKNPGEANYWKSINSIKKLILEGIEFKEKQDISNDYDNVAYVKAMKFAKDK